MQNLWALIQKCFSRVDKDYSFHSPHHHQKRGSLLLTSSAHFTISPPTLQPLPSHIPGLHFIHLQIFAMGGLHHPAPCHGRRPGFTVCLLHSGASGPSTGEVPTLLQQREEGDRSRVGCFSSNLWFSPTSIPMRCHRSLFVTPEDSQMNRSTSKQAGQSRENSGYSSVWGGKEAGLMFGLPSSSRISQALGHVAKAGLGTAMLYELIEVSKRSSSLGRCPFFQGKPWPRIMNMSVFIQVVLVLVRSKSRKTRLSSVSKKSPNKIVR